MIVGAECVSTFGMTCTGVGQRGDGRRAIRVIMGRCRYDSIDP